MNREEHLLVIFAEECSEIAQETAKALRFGVLEQRDLPDTNLDRIEYEWNQLEAMREMLAEGGINIKKNDKIREEKKAKVEKYLRYSCSLGKLEPSETPRLCIAHGGIGFQSDCFACEREAK